MLFVAILFVVTLNVTAFPSERGKMNQPNEFLSNLRRQLTRDNYDYSGDDAKSESEKQTLRFMRADSKLDEPLKDKLGSAQRDDLATTNRQRQLNRKAITRLNFYVPGISEAFHRPVKSVTLEVQKSRKVEHTVSDRDLLYYMDDRELVPTTKEKIHVQDEVKHDMTKAKLKYKTLKFKHQYRRKNQPRLIQEEQMGTVAIVNLDQGPIPEVRLPPARRQYMQDRGEIVGDEEEILPPPVNSSEPEAAPVEEYTTAMILTPETIRA